MSVWLHGEQVYPERHPGGEYDGPSAGEIAQEDRDARAFYEARAAAERERVAVELMKASRHA